MSSIRDLLCVRRASHGKQVGKPRKGEERGGEWKRREERREESGGDRRRQEGVQVMIRKHG